MLISRYRRLTDEERAKSGNKYLVMQRTTGIYGHLPKFMNHRKHPYKYGTFGDYDGIEEDQRDYDEWLASTRWPWEYIRLTYHGYLSFLTKNHRYYFWYMGGSPRKKIFERF